MNKLNPVTTFVFKYLVKCRNFPIVLNICCPVVGKHVTSRFHGHALATGFLIAFTK